VRFKTDIPSTQGKNAKVIHQIKNPDNFCLGVIWDLSVKKIDDDTCEFVNEVHSFFTPELLDSLAKQGIPWEVFQAARKPISEAHNRQETPLFAKSIERLALRRK
jgi:hypothetical protein